MTRNKWDESALRNQIANIFVRDVLQEDYDDLVEGYLDEILAAADKIILLAALPPTGGEGMADSLRTMLSLVLIKYGNSDEAINHEVEKAQAMLAALQDSGQGEGLATHAAGVTGKAIADAVILGFLHGVGRQPWDGMHDYIAVSALDYANGKQGAREHLEAKRAPEGIDWSGFEDGLSDAIMDSFGPDWRASDGAKAVIQWLNENAPRGPQ